jgi:hypothetical protein
LVGAVGIEPTTFGLKGRCSTTELRPYVFLTSYIEMTYPASTLKINSQNFLGGIYGVTS